MRRNYIILFSAFLIMILACKEQPKVINNLKTTITDRTPSAVIYEVNIRQYTPEGTLKAFTDQHLERLKNLGVDILWLMPIYPISEKNRKGPLGSYYSVADYLKVNPEMGTMDDLKALVKKAHELGMYVILDWVANHTGWDNAWIYKHPDWYTKDKKGKIISPVPDWTDVADLNYDNDSMRMAMTNAMEYWVKEADIDGFRCDVADRVPLDFWKNVRAKLDSIKPVFMLAEAWEPNLMANGFDADYGWDLLHLINDIGQHKKPVSDIKDYLTRIDTFYAPDDIIMNLVTNHDENSWNGSEYERLDGNVKNDIILTYLLPGMPLIYTGQEAGMKKRLKFFVKDTVNWSDTSMYSFYRTLNTLKHTNSALNAGLYKGSVIFIPSDNPDVLMVLRENGKQKVLGILNFSNRIQTLKITNKSIIGTYNDVFTKKECKLYNSTGLKLEPFQYMVIE